MGELFELPSGKELDEISEQTGREFNLPEFPRTLEDSSGKFVHKVICTATRSNHAQMPEDAAMEWV